MNGSGVEVAMKIFDCKRRGTEELEQELWAYTVIAANSDARARRVGFLCCTWYTK